MLTTIYKHSRNVYAFDRDVPAHTQSGSARAIYVGMAWEDWAPVAVIESAGRLLSFRSTDDGRDFHLFDPPNTAPHEKYTADNVMSGAAGEHVIFLWRDALEDATGRPA